MSEWNMYDTLPEGKHDNLFTYSKGFISQANGGPIPQPLLQKYSPGAKAVGVGAVYTIHGTGQDRPRTRDRVES